MYGKPAGGLCVWRISDTSAKYEMPGSAQSGVRLKAILVHPILDDVNFAFRKVVSVAERDDDDRFSDFMHATLVPPHASKLFAQYPTLRPSRIRGLLAEAQFE
jgi:hypothetical protein